MLQTRIVCGVALACAVTLAGCASSPTSQKIVNWLKSGGDPEDDNRPGYVDTWSQAGKEGRGNRPLEDDGDPFKDLLRSPKAAAIENNLGVK